MPTRRKKKPYKGYTATEQDLATFGKWVLIVAFTGLLLAAIITLDTHIMRIAIIVAIVLGYAIYKDWFTV